MELGTTERGDDMNPTGIEYGQVAWNPVTGCSKVSEACINCWAERMSKRLAGRCGYSKDNPFKVTMHPERLEEPLKWRKPRTVLVSFMGDLFHEDVDVKTLATVFGIMAACPHHTFMVLTKRPADMARFFEELTTRANGKSMMEVFLGDDTNWRCRHILRAAALRATGNGRVATQDLEGWPIPNIWLGVTAENQARADERIPILLQIPAAKRFVSIEPMLGAVDLTKISLGPNGHGLTFYHNSLNGWSTGYNAETHKQKVSRNDQFSRLDWVICGGETGPGARPMHPDWVRSLSDQCIAAVVPFWFKQWGEYCAPSQMPPETYRVWDYHHGSENCWKDDDPSPWKVGKKKAGRLLDDQEWQQMPEVNS